ncbi:MAG TPA: hypothetical protein VIM11_13000 [Tepidisphaeraceae bacterium]
MKVLPKEQKLVAELEAQIGRPVSEEDWKCVDVNLEAHTITVARNPLLAEIRDRESDRPRDADLPATTTP